MEVSENSKPTRESLIWKLRKLIEFSNGVDQDLEAELNHLLAVLMASPTELGGVSDEASASMEQLAFLVNQLQVRIQKRKRVAVDSRRREEVPAKLTPTNLIDVLKRTGRSDAKQTAEELESMILLLSELTNKNFRGDSAERLRKHACDVQEEFLGIKEGKMKNYWRTMIDFGAEKAVESIERDPKGGDLRNQIKEGTIDLDELVSIVKRVLERAESTVSKRFLEDVERELNEGMLEYIIPREKRDPGDPFIRRLAKYIDPNSVLNSRQVTPLEKILRVKSIDLLKEILKTVDEIETFAAQINAYAEEAGGGWLGTKMKQQNDLMDQLFETTDSINIVSYRLEAETETAYLRLLVRNYALLDLRDRLALFVSKLFEGAPAKFLASFLNHKILAFTQELIEDTRHENLRELQKRIQELRKTLESVGARFFLEKERTEFEDTSIESIQHVISAFNEGLHPDYPLIFPLGLAEGWKHFIRLDKTLKKYIKQIRKISKEKTPENAWMKLCTQMEVIQKEIHAL